MLRGDQRQGPREELPPTPQPPATLRPAPADHVAQRHGGQKQAQDEHQLEEEGGARGSEPAKGRPGVPQEGVLGSKRHRGAVSSHLQKPRSPGPREVRLGDGGEGHPAPSRPTRGPHLLDVEGEDYEGTVEQGQQRAVEEAHPDDRLPRHHVQHVRGHEELLPAQPGPEPARESLHQHPGRRAGPASPPGRSVWPTSVTVMATGHPHSVTGTHTCRTAHPWLQPPATPRHAQVPPTRWCPHAAHLLGRLTRKAKATVSRKLKVLSLYSSSPTEVSQHWAEWFRSPPAAQPPRTPLWGHL